MDRIENKSKIFNSPIAAGVMNWGKWGINMSSQEITNYIKELFDVGVKIFDHADIYGDYEEEERFGHAFANTNIARDQVQLVSKCGIRLLSEKYPEDYIKHYNTSYEHIVASAEKSLKLLKTDYLDLLLIHRPSPLMDPIEMARAFEKLKSDGKVLHFGVSNFSPSQFASLNKHYPLVTNQVEASVLHLDPFQDGTFDQALEHNCQPMIWSPLAGGRIFGNTESLQSLISKLNELSLTTGHPLDQLLLAFINMHPSNPILVLGTTKIERVKSALKALDIKLSLTEWFEIWTAATGQDVP